MARPSKETVDYFPHYCTSGKTMFILEERHGNNGYAFWFKLLELLGNSPGHFYDCDEEINKEFLVSKTRQTWDNCARILSLLAKLGAIDLELWSEHQIIWCQNLVNNLSDVYKKRGRKPPVRPGSCDGNPCIPVVSEPETPQSKVKESKVNKSKVKISTPLGDSNNQEEDEEPPESADFQIENQKEEKSPLCEDPMQFNKAEADAVACRFRSITKETLPNGSIITLFKCIETGHINYFREMSPGHVNKFLVVMRVLDRFEEKFKKKQGFGDPAGFLIGGVVGTKGNGRYLLDTPTDAEERAGPAGKRIDPERYMQWFVKK